MPKPTSVGSGAGRKSVEGGCEAAESRMAMELAPTNKGQLPTDCGFCACANSYVQLDRCSFDSRRDKESSCRRGSAWRYPHCIGIRDIGFTILGMRDRRSSMHLYIRIVAYIHMYRQAVRLGASRTAVAQADNCKIVGVCTCVYLYTHPS